NSFDDLQLSFIPDEMIIKVEFKFRSNPYFDNHVICRKYSLKKNRLRLSTLTPIKWKDGHEPAKNEGDKEAIKPNPTLVFFDWLSSLNQFDQMAHWIIFKMYPNAFKMFSRIENSENQRAETSSIASDAQNSTFEQTPCDTITEQA
ncbi:unnamed protein product, partial [Oikopleura dioica]